jgi:multidrug resistance efflux pump
VSPEVSGRIIKLDVLEGQRVRAGQVLGEIESVQYTADLARAQATLELARQRLLELERGNRPEEIKQAEAELAELQAQLPSLEADWQRSQQLRQTRSISAQDYESAESLYRAMLRRIEKLKYALTLMQLGPRAERIAAARAEVEQADADLRKARWRLDNCLIRAPISGTILRKNAEQGNVVNPVAFNGSFSLCEMADLSNLEVELNIQERDVAKVFAGQACQVRAEAYPERVYQGVVSRLMPIADRAKGAVPVRVKLTVPAEEEGVYLKPEMGAEVVFLARPQKET